MSTVSNLQTKAQLASPATSSIEKLFTDAHKYKTKDQLVKYGIGELEQQ